MEPTANDISQSAQERLDRFEQVLAEVEREHDSLESQIETLKAQGKLKTATLQQLLARKLTLSQFLAMFEKQGLR